jgi:hypothetical protein
MVLWGTIDASSIEREIVTRTIRETDFMGCRINVELLLELFDTSFQASG